MKIKNVSLAEIQENLQGCYLKLEKSFTRKLILSVNDKSSFHNKILADFLGAKFNEKWNCCPKINYWFATGVIPIPSIEKLLSTSKLKWSDVEKNLLGIKVKGKIILKVKFPINLDRNIGRIVGHILGDGSIDKKYLQPFYTNQNKILLKEFETSVLTIFGLTPRIWIQKPGDFKNEKAKWIKRVNSIEEIPNGMQGGLFYPKILGVILYSVFGQFAKGKSKKITKNIFYFEDEFKLGLLQAIYDDEGSVSVDSGTIRFFQDNKKLLSDMKKLLDNFGINSRKITVYKKKHFYFDIHGIKNFKRFQKLIDFSSLEKSTRLEELIEITKIGLKERITKGKIEFEIISVLKNQNLRISEILDALRKSNKNILWRRRSIDMCLNQLTQKGKIKRNQIKTNEIYWSLNENLDSISQ